MSKILITGATGFIGQALCPFLLEKGISIKSVLREPQNQYPFDFSIVKNALSAEEWGDALEDVEIVIHLAAQAHGVKRGAYAKRDQDILDLFNINVLGTKALIQACLKKGIKHFVYLSSIKVNGEVSFNQPFSEKDVPNPSDEYAQSKLEAEEIVKASCARSNMSYTILRPSLVYGPKVKGNFLDLLTLCASRFPLPFLDFNNKRSLTYIENLLDIIYLALVHPRAKNETFLTCDDQDISIKDLIIKMRNSMKLSLNLWYCPLSILAFIFKIFRRKQAFLRLAAPLQINNQKIKSYLGWKPRFLTDQGLEKTVEWFLFYVKK